MHQQSGWQLKLGERGRPLGARIAALVDARKTLEGKLPAMLPPDMKAGLDGRRHGLVEDGVPAALADRLALLDTAYIVPEASLVARSAKAGLVEATRALLAVSDAFRIGRIEESSRAISQNDYFDGLALSRAYDMIGDARRGMAIAALTQFGNADDPVGSWLAAGGERIARARERLQALTEGGDLTLSRFTVAAGLMTDLAGL